MDVVDGLFDLLFEYGLLLMEFLAPYKMEMVIGIVFATFILGFIYSHR